MAVDLRFCWGRGCASVVVLIAHGVKPNAETVAIAAAAKTGRHPRSSRSGNYGGS